VMLIGLGVTALVWAIALGFEVWRQVKASRLSGGPVAVAV
jgi:hypothetical protein